MGVLDVLVEDHENFQSALEDFSDLVDDFDELQEWDMFASRCREVTSKLESAIDVTSNMIDGGQDDKVMQREVMKLHSGLFDVFSALYERIKYNMELLADTATSEHLYEMTVEDAKADHNTFVEFLDGLADVYAVWGNPNHPMLSKWRSFDKI